MQKLKQIALEKAKKLQEQPLALSSIHEKEQEWALKEFVDAINKQKEKK